MKNSVKYFIGCGVPVFVCNFRCKYCYLGQHPDTTSKGIVPFSKSPEYIASFFSVDKIGGYCYFNMCSSGETMMHPQLIELVSRLTKQGHYVDIISNGTLSKKYDQLVESLDEDQRKHVLIKFSWHYLELKRLNLMDKFVDNINKVKNAGISYSIEITPNDDLVPYIDEIKVFSLKHFGALPHITVARNEATSEIEILSRYNRMEYNKIWSSFDSDMFDFKLSVFNKKRCEFCYAGLWSLQFNLRTGDFHQCYGGDFLGNIKEGKIHFSAIGKCRQPHCFNAHAYLTYGVIPDLDTPTYCQMRDRVTNEGKHWIQSETREFFNTRLKDSNDILLDEQKNRIVKMADIRHAVRIGKEKMTHATLKLREKDKSGKQRKNAKSLFE